MNDFDISRSDFVIFNFIPTKGVNVIVIKEDFDFLFVLCELFNSKRPRHEGVRFNCFFQFSIPILSLVSWNSKTASWFFGKIFKLSANNDARFVTANNKKVHAV